MVTSSPVSSATNAVASMHGHRDLDARHGAHLLGDVLGEERALAGAHLERRAPGHGVDDLDEGAEHGAVHQVDGGDQRDPRGQGDDGQREPHVAAAEEAQRHAEAGRGQHRDAVRL